MNGLPPVGEGEEYPVMGGQAPRGFQEVSAGWVCVQCGSVVPRQRDWANVHLDFHREGTAR